jgi:hypothetical protein
MKIRRESWHYGLIVRFFNWYAPDNLCAYFWKLVSAIIVLIGIPLLIFAILGIVIYAWVSSPQWASNTILLVFIVSGAVVPAITIHYLRKLTGGPVAEIPKDSLVVEYIKTKKRKVCPLIEYVG